MKTYALKSFQTQNPIYQQHPSALGNITRQTQSRRLYKKKTLSILLKMTVTDEKINISPDPKPKALLVLSPQD